MSANAVTSFVLRTLKEHLSMRAQRALYGKPVLTEMGDKYPLPKGEGFNMYIPKHTSQNLWRELTEFTVLSQANASGTSAGRYTVTVAGYADIRKYSGFWRIVNSLPSQIPNDIDDMMRYGTKKIDDLTRAKISGLGTQVAADGSTLANVRTATNLKARAIFHAGMKLADNNAPEYSDGLYRGVIRPAQAFDLFTNLSGGTSIGDYIVNTDVGANKLERLTVNVLGRVRVMESTWSPRSYTGVAATSAAGLSVGATGYEAYFTGQGAFACTDLATARLETIVHPPGSSGTYDAVDEIGTVGCKFYYGAGAMDTTNRLVRVVSGTTF